MKKFKVSLIFKESKASFISLPAVIFFCLFSNNFIVAQQGNCFTSLSMLQSIQNGTVTISNTTIDIGNIKDVFDNNSITLARSANINPLVVTASFANTIYLDSVTVEQSYSSGWFTLECANALNDLITTTGSYQLLLNMIPTTAPNTTTGVPVTRAASVNKKIFRLTVRRTTGDNFVHLNEWKLFGKYFDKPELGPAKTQFFCPAAPYADISHFFDSVLMANPGYSKIGWFNNQSWLAVDPKLATWGPTYALIIQDAKGCRDTGFVNTITYPTFNIMSSIPQVLFANKEITDTSGWTHYLYSYNTGSGGLNEILLLSIKKNGNNIGTVNDGVFQLKLVATAGAGSGDALHIQNPLIQNPSGFYAMNRYWQIIPTNQPVSEVNIRYYFTNTDIEDVKGSVPHVWLGTQLNMYKTEGGDPNPATNFAGAFSIKSIASGNLPSIDSFKYTFLGCNEHLAEFKVQSLSGGGGGGSTFNGRAFADTSTKTIYPCSNNTLQSIQNGTATITNTPIDIGNINNIFDGNNASLARSANINPMIVTASFTNTVNLTSVKVLQLATAGWFTLEAANTLADLNSQSGSYQLLLNMESTINDLAKEVAVFASKKIYRLTVKKTIGDNFVHLTEWGIYGSTINVADKIISSQDSIKMFTGWKVYVDKPGYYQVPKLVSINGTDSLAVNSACINWSVKNISIAEIKNNILIAKSAGFTLLNASLGTTTIQIPIKVSMPVVASNKENAMDPFLATPAECHASQIPVLVIVYLPTKDGLYFDTEQVPGFNNQLLSSVKSHAQKIHIHTKFSLEEGSKFRGYSNPSAKPYLGYKIVDYIYVYEPLPLSIPDNPVLGNYWVDYNQIIEKHQGKYYVDTLGVKEIWIMGYHTNKVSPLESNMASKTTGNISNSYRREDDLPKFDKTYIVYNYNITRGGNEATHNHGHQTETMADYVAIKQDGNGLLFSRDFRGYTAGGQGPLNRCGDTHHPPNSRIDYDYENSTLVASDIMDWKPSGGLQTMVNKNTWGNIPYTWPSSLYPAMPPTAESNWYIFWMQNIPGNGNQIQHGSRYMTNWWRFMADWDSASTRIGLHQSIPEQNLNGCASGGISYSFTGNGKWSNANNWQGFLRPPNPIPEGHKIIINTSPGGNCILDIPYIFNNGMEVTIKSGKQLIVQKN